MFYLGLLYGDDGIEWWNPLYLSSIIVCCRCYCDFLIAWLYLTATLMMVKRRRRGWCDAGVVLCCTGVSWLGLVLLVVSGLNHTQTETPHGQQHNNTTNGKTYSCRRTNTINWSDCCLSVYQWSVATVVNIAMTINKQSSNLKKVLLKNDQLTHEKNRIFIFFICLPIHAIIHFEG